MSETIDYAIIVASGVVIYFYLKDYWNDNNSPGHTDPGDPQHPQDPGKQFTPTDVMRMEDELESWLQSVEHYKLAASGVGYNDYWAAAQSFYKKQGWDPGDFTTWAEKPEGAARIQMYSWNPYWGPAPGTSKPSN